MRVAFARPPALTAACAALLALGCSPRERGPEQVIHRLVEPTFRAEGAPAPATPTWRPPDPIARALIGDDSRYVLTEHEELRLAFGDKVERPIPDRLAIRFPVGNSLAGATRVLLYWRVKIGGAGWQDMPTKVVPITQGSEGRLLEAVAPLENAPPGVDTLLIAIAYRLPDDHTTTFETRPLEVPSDATLGFATGIAPVAFDQGAVRFSVETCAGGDCQPLFAGDVDPTKQEDRTWHDRRVSLETIGGSTRSFRFRTEPLRGADSASLPLWGNPVITAPRTLPRRPNVILLSIDTLRRDHLDLYGHPRETAPFLRDELGAKGVVFEDLIAEAASTDASHMTLFSSLPSLVHRVTSGWDETRLVNLGFPTVTLAQALMRNGYRTAAFTEDGPLAWTRGFATGFEEYTENRSPHILHPMGLVAMTFAQARAWLERRDELPYFLFLHTFQVHSPYLPPEAYHAYFAEEQARAGIGPTQKESAEFRYDREIRYVDDELARLYRWVETRGPGANTIWIVLSDHGEEFLEHGAIGHNTLPFDEVLRVPLIVRGPGIVAGRRVDAPLHHVDVMPTLLDLLGVPPPAGLYGRSFAAALRGEPLTDFDRGRPRFSTSWLLLPPYTAPALTVRRGASKLILHRTASGDGLDLYDLAADPREQRPIRTNDTEAGALRDLLEAYVREMEQAHARRAATSSVAPQTTGVDPAREEMLRALGYIQ